MADNQRGLGAALPPLSQQSHAGGEESYVSRAWDRGLAGLGQSLSDAAEFIGEQIGDDGLADFGREAATGAQVRQMFNPPDLESYQDIDGLASFGQYVVEQTVTNAPNLALMAAGGAVGAGSKMALARIGGAAASQTARTASKEALKRWALGGSAAAIYPAHLGESAAALKESGIDLSTTIAPWLVAGVNTALDVGGVERVLAYSFRGLDKDLSKQLVKQLSREYSERGILRGVTRTIAEVAKAGGKGAAAGAGVEAATELTQEIIKNAARAYHDPEYDPFSPDAVRAMTEVAASAAASGGAMAGAGRTASTGLGLLRESFTGEAATPAAPPPPSQRDPLTPPPAGGASATRGSRTQRPASRVSGDLVDEAQLATEADRRTTNVAPQYGVVPNSLRVSDRTRVTTLNVTDNEGKTAVLKIDWGNETPYVSLQVNGQEHRITDRRSLTSRFSPQVVTGIARILTLAKSTKDIGRMRTEASKHFGNIQQPQAGAVPPQPATAAPPQEQVNPYANNVVDAPAEIAASVQAGQVQREETPAEPVSRNPYDGRVIEQVPEGSTAEDAVDPSGAFDSPPPPAPVGQERQTADTGPADSEVLSDEDSDAVETYVATNQEEPDVVAYDADGNRFRGDLRIADDVTVPVRFEVRLPDATGSKSQNADQTRSDARRRIVTGISDLVAVLGASTGDASVAIDPDSVQIDAQDGSNTAAVSVVIPPIQDRDADMTNPTVIRDLFQAVRDGETDRNKAHQIEFVRNDGGPTRRLRMSSTTMMQAAAKMFAGRSVHSMSEAELRNVFTQFLSWMNQRGYSTVSSGTTAKVSSKLAAAFKEIEQNRENAKVDDVVEFDVPNKNEPLKVRLTRVIASALQQFSDKTIANATVADMQLAYQQFMMLMANRGITPKKGSPYFSNWSVVPANTVLRVSSRNKADRSSEVTWADAQQDTLFESTAEDERRAIHQTTTPKLEQRLKEIESETNAEAAELQVLETKVANEDRKLSSTAWSKANADLKALRRVRRQRAREAQFIQDELDIRTTIAAPVDVEAGLVDAETTSLQVFDEPADADAAFERRRQDQRNVGPVFDADQDGPDAVDREVDREELGANAAQPESTDDSFRFQTIDQDRAAQAALDRAWGSHTPAAPGLQADVATITGVNNKNVKWLNNIVEHTAKLFDSLGIPLTVRFTDMTGLQALLAAHENVASETGLANKEILQAAVTKKPAARVMFLRQKDGTVRPLVLLSQNSKNRTKQLRQTFHELGHIVLRYSFDAAPRDVIRHLKAVTYAGESFHEFEERFANLFANWIVDRGMKEAIEQDASTRGVQDAARGMMDFFKDTTALFRRFWLKGKTEWAVTESFNDFMQMLLNSKNADGRIKDPMFRGAAGITRRDIARTRDTDEALQQTIRRVQALSYRPQLHQFLDYTAAPPSAQPEGAKPSGARFERMSRAAKNASSGLLKAMQDAFDTHVKGMDHWLRDHNLSDLANHFRRQPGAGGGRHGSTVHQQMAAEGAPFVNRLSRLAQQYGPKIGFWQAVKGQAFDVQAEQSAEAQEAMQRFLTGLPQVSDLGRQVATMFDDLAKFMVDHGVPLRQVKNYFPIVWSRSKLMDEGIDSLRTVVNQWRVDYPTESQAFLEAEANEIGNPQTPEWYDRQAEKFVVRLFNNLTAEETSAVETHEGFVLASPTFSAGYRRQLPNTLIPRMDAFRENDLFEVLTTYTHSAIKRGVWQQRFGLNEELARINRKFEQAASIKGRGPEARAARQAAFQEAQQYKEDRLNHYADTYQVSLYDPAAKLVIHLQNKYRNGELNDQELAFVRDKVIPSYQGRLGANMSNGWRSVQMGAIAYQNWRVLATGVFAQVIDTGILINNAKGHRWEALSLTLGAYINKAKRQEIESLAYSLGAIRTDLTEHILNDESGLLAMSQLSRRANESLFRLNGMHFITNANRAVALVIGKRMFESALRDGDTNFLNEMGVTPADVENWFADGAPMDYSDKHDAMFGALHQFIDESVLRPNATTRPQWGNNQKYAIFWHLKSFMWEYAYTVLGKAWNRAQRIYSNAEGMQRLAATMPFLALAAFTLPFTMLGLEARWLLTNPKNRPEGGSPAYIWELVQRSGILGLGQILADMEQSREHNRFMLLAAAGPSVGQFADMAMKMSEYDPLNFLPAASAIRGIGRYAE